MEVDQKESNNKAKDKAERSFLVLYFLFRLFNFMFPGLRG